MRWMEVLGVAASLLGAAGSARAAEAPDAGVPATDGGALPPPDAGAPAYQTVVTALRLPRPQADVPAATIVVPRDEIERSPALTADNLMRELPSVSTFPG